MKLSLPTSRWLKGGAGVREPSWSGVSSTSGFSVSPEFAEDLLQGLDELDGWPDKVRTMQRNWIGASEGCEITFAFTPDSAKRVGTKGFTVFTTRPDTLYGAAFCALAPQHPLSATLAQEDKKIAAFVAEVAAETP